MHHAVGAALLLYCIAYAFGKPAARVIVGSVLVTGALAFTYVAFCIVTGSM